MSTTPANRFDVLAADAVSAEDTLRRLRGVLAELEAAQAQIASLTWNVAMRDAAIANLNFWLRSSRTGSYSLVGAA